MRFIKSFIAALLAELLLATPAFAAWSGPVTLGSFTDGTGAASKSISGVNASAGTFVIFSGATFTGSTTGNMSVSDSASNTWSFQAIKSSSNNMVTWIAWSVLTNTISGGTLTITSTTNNLLGTYMGAASFSGQATGTVEDTSVRASSFNQALTNSPTITSGTPTASGDLMIAAMGEYLTTGDTYTEDTAHGWTTIYDGTQPNVGHWGFAYQINAGSGAKIYNPTVGSSTNNNFAMLTAGFLVGGGPPPPSTNKLPLNHAIP